MKMSSSSSPATQAGQEPEIIPFVYAEIIAQDAGDSRQPDSSAGQAESVPATSEILAQREAAAREAGRRDGEAQGRAAGEQYLTEIRESVGAVLADFARDRAGYYRQVETEVVQLALAIARKILHREAQLDPLLLAGLVRVTLEEIESATKVVVRVNPQQVSECRSYFAQHMESRSVPEVMEDSTVKLDCCRLQTALGATELGAEVQLKEIERGLFDLLAVRPTTI
jgi:flagellar assembly protein FliH